MAILTELHKIRLLRSPGPSTSTAVVVAEFPVLHLRRRSSEWIPFVSLYATNSGVLQHFSLARVFVVVLELVYCPMRLCWCPSMFR